MVNLVINAVTFEFPETGDDDWGDAVQGWASAVTAGMLQKAGGSFALTADVDFGASFGLKSAYYKSRSSNPASAGQVRLGNAEAIKWRSAANSADLALLVNASNLLEFEGNQLLTTTGSITASRVLVSDGSSSIVSSSVTSTTLGYLDVGSSLTTLLAAKAPTASPTFTGTITTPLTASRAVVTGASSELAASAVTATELGYVSGVTSAVQTQLNAKQATAIAPTIQKFLSGSGTYTKAAGVLYIRVRVVGAGGGGAGSTGGGSGGAGGNSTFGTSLLSANGGAGGVPGSTSSTAQAAGGVASLGTGPVGIAVSGGTGGPGTSNSTGIISLGGYGGNTAFGGAGAGGNSTGAGSSGATNTGAGGGGAGGPASGYAGGGGGAGGFVDALITSPSATYTYQVGAGGTAGTLAGVGAVGGAGGSGLVEVTEHYQ